MIMKFCRRRCVLFSEVHEAGPASPAREPRALPRMFARAFILSITAPRRARHQFARVEHEPFRLPPWANSCRRNRREWAARDDRDRSARRIASASMIGRAADDELCFESFIYIPWRPHRIALKEQKI